jgi:hypothetical protein
MFWDVENILCFIPGVDGWLGSRLQGYNPLEGPLCTAFQLHPSSRGTPCQATWETSVSEGITGEKWPVNLDCDSDSHVNHRVILHAANLRHGTDFTSPPKEGILWIFTPEKIRRLRPGLNPRSCVPEASMLPTRPPKLLLFQGNGSITVTWFWWHVGKTASLHV